LPAIDCTARARLVAFVDGFKAGDANYSNYDEGITLRLYRFLTGPDDASFCHRVTAALNNGWNLFGSPTSALAAKISPFARWRLDPDPP
jgi:hypothetical protein